MIGLPFASHLLASQLVFPCPVQRADPRRRDLRNSAKNPQPLEAMREQKRQRHRAAGRHDIRQLPSARERFAEIADRIDAKSVALFLDYDGTLTPIVDRPEQARLSEEMRAAIRALTRHATVAVVSGRDLQDVRALVALDGLFYAGSHGFDIAGPEGREQAFEEAREFLPVLDRAEKELHARLDGIRGALLERKRFSIAIHYREVAEGLVSGLEARIDEVLSHHPRLRKTAGKRIFDLQPKIDWHKGKAVQWLLGALGLDRADVLTCYIGDDVTDENAFAALQERGIGIVVRDGSRPTKAAYALEHPDDVKAFLNELAHLLEDKANRSRATGR